MLSHESTLMKPLSPRQYPEALSVVYKMLSPLSRSVPNRTEYSSTQPEFMFKKMVIDFKKNSHNFSDVVVSGKELPECSPGGVLPIMAYTVRLRPKGVPFSGFRYKKG